MIQTISHRVSCAEVLVVARAGGGGGGEWDVMDSDFSFIHDVGPCVVHGFSISMEAFDKLLSINVPWSQEFPAMDCSLPGSSVRGILQARILE